MTATERPVVIPRPPEVPAEVHASVVEQVTASIQARQAAASALASPLASWEAALDGPAPTSGDEDEMRIYLERNGLTSESYRASTSLGHDIWMANAARLTPVPTTIPHAPRTGPILVAHPRVWTAPYQGSGWWQTSTPPNGFEIGAGTRLPLQPNGQARVDDPTTGLVGTGFVVEHDASLFSGSAQVFAQEFDVVGVWVQLGNQPLGAWANVTTSALAFATVGDSFLWGGGSATLTSGAILEAFTAPQGIESLPASSAHSVVAHSFSPQSVGDSERPSFSPGPMTPMVSLPFPALSWVWLMAGTFQQITASVSHTTLNASIFATMQVASISAWL